MWKPCGHVQGEIPSADQLKKLIHQGVIANKLVPVFCGSAFKNKGVQPLLDGVVSLPPSPHSHPWCLMWHLSLAQVLQEGGCRL